MRIKRVHGENTAVPTKVHADHPGLAAPIADSVRQHAPRPVRIDDDACSTGAQARPALGLPPRRQRGAGAGQLHGMQRHVAPQPGRGRRRLPAAKVGQRRCGCRKALPHPRHAERRVSCQQLRKPPRQAADGAVR